MSATSITDSRPDSGLRPAAVFLGFLTGGLLLEAMSPFPVLPEWLEPLIGGAALAAGVAIMALRIAHWRAAGADGLASLRDSPPVARGVYGFSRNPTYVAMAAFYLGVAAWVDSLWLILLFLPLVLVLRWGVVAREEAYLSAKFGIAYERYCARVPRWL